MYLNKYFYLLLSTLLFLASVEIHGQTKNSLPDTAAMNGLLEASRAAYNNYDLEEAVALGLECLEGVSLYPEWPNILRLNSLLTFAYMELGVIDSFRLFQQKTLQLAEQHKDVEVQLRMHNVIANFYSDKLRFDSALLAYDKSLTLIDVLPADQLQWKSTIYNNIAIIFGQQGQIPEARSYFKKSVDIGMQIQDTTSIVLGTLNIVRSFIEAPNSDSARYYLDLTKAYKIDSPFLSSLQQDVSGRYYSMTRQYDKAIEAQRKALHFYYQTANERDIAQGHMMLGQAFNDNEQYDSALFHLKLALPIAQTTEANELVRELYSGLAAAYEKTGNWEEAYLYSQEYHNLRDTFFAKEMSAKVAELETQLGLQQMELENLHLKDTARSQKAALYYQNIILGVFIVLLLIISALSTFLYFSNRENKRLSTTLAEQVKHRTAELQQANQEMQKSLEELRVFSYITSHDLKEPLRNISGFTSLLEKRLTPDLDAETLEFMAHIRQNAKHMHQLINGILFYSNLSQQNGERIPSDQIVLHDLLQEITTSLSTYIQQNGAIIHYPQLKLTLTSSREALNIILKNLIENGIKYNNSKPPQIWITYKGDESNHYLAVRDNGIGIEKEYQEQIFELFKRLHNRQHYEGSGIGLAICRKIAGRIKGTLTVESQPGEGSTFLLQLPKGQ